MENSSGLVDEHDYTAELARANEALRRGVERLSAQANLTSLTEAVLAEAVGAVSAAAGALILRVDNSTTAYRISTVYEDGTLTPEEIAGDPYLGRFTEISVTDPGGIFSALSRGESSSVSVQSMRTWFPEAHAYHSTRGHRTVWNAPLLLKGTLLGYLSLAMSSDAPPSPAARETISALTHQLALAAELTRLAEENRMVTVAHERDKAAEERAAELIKANEIMKRAANRLVCAAEPDDILPLVLEEACRAMGASEGALFEYRPESQELVLEHAVNRGELRCSLSVTPCVDCEQAPVPLASFEPWEELIRRDEPVYECVSEKSVLLWNRLRKHRGVLRRALLTDKQAYGLLILGFRKDRKFSPTELELFNTLTQQATLAFQMARLAQAAKRKAAEAATLAERNRIAREIHDTLAQGFTGVLMQLEAIDQSLHSHDETRAALHLENAATIARSSLAEARRSVKALRPSELESGSLVDAIKLVAHLASEQSGVPITVDCDRAAQFAPEHANELLRIVQESLTNAIKHGMPKSIAVTCFAEGERQVLQISDIGSGFDITRRTEGFGLVGMRERAARIGAEFSLQSDSAGTVVSVSLPVGVEVLA